jgi:hypothetical protein
MKTPTRGDRPAPRSTDLPNGSQADDGSLPTLSRLLLTGSFAEQVTLIPRSMSSLIIATGYLEEGEDRPVLLPFVEMMFAGARQGDVPDGEVNAKLEPIFSRTLPLENALWLSFDVVRDIRLACATLRGMIQGNASFDAARLAHARHYADRLRMEAEMCAALIDELSPGSGSSAAETQATAKDEGSEASSSKRGSKLPARRLKARTEKR